MDEEIKRTLEKQLELLSERSKEPGSDLPALTHAMVEIAMAIPYGSQKDVLAENDATCLRKAADKSFAEAFGVVGSKSANN